MRRVLLAAIAAALLLSLAPAASAAPDRSVELSRDSRVASWASDLNVGNYLQHSSKTREQRCVQGCDETLINLSASGTLRVTAVRRGPVTSPAFYAYA